MSKDAAMALLTGSSVPTQNPSPPQSEVTSIPSEGVSPSAASSPPKELQSTPFSQLAKKESDLVRQKQEIKKQQELMASEKAKMSEIQKQVQLFEETKKKDPIAALKMIGFTETDIFNYMAAQEKPELSPEEKAAQAAVEATEAKLKAYEEAQLKKVQEEQTKRDQSLIQGFKEDLNQVIASDPVQFEYCHHYGPVAQELMYETTLAVYQASDGKEVLTPREAAEMVEAYYEEQDKLMSSLKKRQPTPVAPSASEEAQAPTRSRTVTTPAGSEPPKPVIHKTRTLTNAATGTVASTRHRMNETKEQKKERLIMALREGKI